MENKLQIDSKGYYHRVIRKDTHRGLWIIDEGTLEPNHSFLWGIRETDRKQLFILINEKSKEEKEVEDYRVTGAYYLV